MSITIDRTAFGSITINGRTFDHDVIIRLSGEIVKRKKKLSKQVYGTSHTVSAAEAEYVYEPSCNILVVGSGQYGVLKLSAEAAKFFEQQECKVILKPTPDAIHAFNNTTGPKIGLFHVTC
jgi:hypothetical protein